MAWREQAAYACMSTGRKTACGQRRRASQMGMAERTPKGRDS